MKKLYKFFSSPILAILLLLIFSVAMAWATFVENDYGTKAAWVYIYETWWFEVVMVGLALSFVANIFKYQLFRKEKWAVLIFHVAFIIIVIGAGITRYTSYGGMLRIREGQAESTVISGDNYLQIQLRAGQDSIRIIEKLGLSNVKKSRYSLETTLDNSAIKIGNLRYVVDAVPVLIEDEQSDEQILELVISYGIGKETIFIKSGNYKTVGSDKLIIGFNCKELTNIAITSKEGSLEVVGDKKIEYYKMMTQEAGSLESHKKHPFFVKTLYKMGSLAIVPNQFVEHGKIEVESVNPAGISQNKKELDDVVLADVQVGDRLETVPLLYREGFLAAKSNVQLAGIQIDLSYGSKALELPFKVQLNDFQLEKYPGSTSPSSYASEVTVIDGAETMPFRIYMNNVLDYKGFRFFQASYDTDEKGTVLSVNHDAIGTNVTYVGYFLMTVGMFFTLFGRQTRFRVIVNKLKKLKTAVVLLALLWGNGLFANPNSDAEIISKSLHQLKIPAPVAEEFGALLVQDLDGRIKPVNTLALEFLRKISGKPYYKYEYQGTVYKCNAVQVFLMFHMYPELWQGIPVIKANGKKLSPVLAELKDKKRLAFKDLLKEAGAYKLSEAIVASNQKKPAERNETDKEIIKVDERFNILYNVLLGNYLKIFPNRLDKNHTWYSHKHHFEDYDAEDAAFCKGVVSDLFSKAKQQDWAGVLQLISYVDLYQTEISKDIIPSKEKVQAEIWYNKFNLNFWLFQAYFTLGLVLLVLAIVRIFNQKKWLEHVWFVVFLLTVVSFLVFAFNIGLRWYISGHAPWSNGYEMLVFVAWGLLLSGLLVHKKSDFALPLATLFTGVLLLVSYLDWINPEITNLMPVLKSYWLKIHVATIVSSYAPLGLSCVLGMMALILMNFQKGKNAKIIKVKIKELSYINELSMTVGLFLLSVGTFLGGVWANESWGRYWAWDPKETWALISIIVYTVVLHLRFIPAFNNKYVLNLVSMFAFWSIIMTSFGVNYYLTGLHSYATGDPVPIPNFVYVLIVLMFVLAILPKLISKQQRKAER
ncbi:cytochrome c biogenesis protein CcsA [Wenyingzhuangia sp. IMCC45574]